jgi:hypothetical protein
VTGRCPEGTKEGEVQALEREEDCSCCYDDECLVLWNRAAMADDGQKSGIWGSMQDKEDSGLRIVNPKKSETGSGEPDVSEFETSR